MTPFRRNKTIPRPGEKICPRFFFFKKLFFLATYLAIDCLQPLSTNNHDAPVRSFVRPVPISLVMVRGEFLRAAVFFVLLRRKVLSFNAQEASFFHAQKCGPIT